MNIVVVAVGVLVDEADRVLITRRADDTHQGGLWEFPGGKVESGESVAEALARELNEELGTDISDAVPLMNIEHDYGDKAVRLEVLLVRDWSGEPYGAEGQPLAWVAREELSRFEFPAANQSIIDCLAGQSEQR